MTTSRPTFDDFLAWLEDSRTHGQVHFDDKAQCWQVPCHPETSAVRPYGLWNTAALPHVQAAGYRAAFQLTGQPPSSWDTTRCSPDCALHEIDDGSCPPKGCYESAVRPTSDRDL
jgi:hypothetical protein